MNEITANDDILKEKIIQDLVAGCSIPQAAAAYGVELDYIDGILKLPRFSGSGSSNHRKAMQLARIDAATKALMPGVQAGNHSDIEAWLKVAKREAALTGLDAPVKTESDLKMEVVLKYSNPDFNKPAPAVIEDVSPKPWLEPAPEPKAAPGVVFRPVPAPGTAAAIEAAKGKP